MRGAGGCPMPSAESLGGGRVERRRAVRAPVRRSAKTNRIRDHVEGKEDIDQRGKTGGSPDDRPGGRARFSCRRAERSSGASARGAFARFGGIRSPALSGRRMRRNSRRLRLDERSADRIGRELRNFFGVDSGGGASGVSAAGDRAKGLATAIPENYFPDDDPAKTPYFKWKSHAYLLYANWLNYYVYQATPYDLSHITMEFKPPVGHEE